MLCFNGCIWYRATLTCQVCWLLNMAESILERLFNAIEKAAAMCGRWEILEFVFKSTIYSGCYGLTTGCILPIGYSVLLPWILKNSFEKKGWQVFPLFKSICLRNRSLSNARWFYSKKCKIRKGNLYLTENWLSRNKMWCTADNHYYMCHICAKEVLDVNFNHTVIAKISNFQEIAPNFT